MTTKVTKQGAVRFEVAGFSTLMDQALDKSTRPNQLAGREQVLEAIRGGNCDVCGRARYNLAVVMAEQIGALDPTVKAVYTYEPDYATDSFETVDDAGGQPTGIYMIIWAERKTAALESLQASLRATVAEDWRMLGCPNVCGRCTSFDIQIVDDAQVAAKSGYGALVESIHVRPLQIYHR